MDDIQQKLELLAAHRRTLAVYLQRLALVGAAHITPEVAHGIDDERAQIARIKAELRAANVKVDDDPNDIAHSSKLHYNASSPARRGAMPLLLLGLVVAVFFLGFRTLFPSTRPQPVDSAPSQSNQLAQTGPTQVAAELDAPTSVPAQPTNSIAQQAAIPPTEPAQPTTLAPTVAPTEAPASATNLCTAAALENINYPEDGKSPALKSGVAYKGLILPGESQAYSFSAERGVAMTFLMEQGAGIKSWMVIYDATGNQITSSRSVHEAQITLNFIPRFSGDYTIRIEYWGGQGDNYTLRRVTAEDLAVIVPGKKCEGSITTQPFAEYRFDGTAGKTVNFVYEQSPGLQAWLKVYDLNRNELASSRDVHPAEVTLSFTPPSTGSYIVRLELWGGGGAYNIGVTE